MRTRSNSIHEIPIIDFDEASVEWRKNKQVIIQGSYKYIHKYCAHVKGQGVLCKRIIGESSIYCSSHSDRTAKK